MNQHTVAVMASTIQQSPSQWSGDSYTVLEPQSAASFPGYSKHPSTQNLLLLLFFFFLSSIATYVERSHGRQCRVTTPNPQQSRLPMYTIFGGDGPAKSKRATLH